MKSFKSSSRYGPNHGTILVYALLEFILVLIVGFSLLQASKVCPALA